MSAQALDIQHENNAPVQRGDAPATELTPIQMAYQLINQGADFASVKEMMALGKELAADRARRAFDDAMASAKSEIPVIVKNRKVGYEHKNGGGETNYRHEDLGEIARTVDPILAKYGLSYRFRPTSEPNQPVSVTCILSHRDGHSEETTLTAGRDESGKKNSIQAIGSTITYLQRYTLKAALGLAASHDDDGSKADEKQTDVITKDQFQQINRLLGDAKVNIGEFCKAYKVDCVADLPASFFDEAVKLLKKNIAKAAMEGVAK